MSEGFDLQAPLAWDEKSAAIAAEMLDKRMRNRIRRFYCPRGRTCDGQPHDLFDYPHARGDQWPPVGLDWFVWLVISGRGAGKTRTGSEWVRAMADRVPAIALVARTGPDLRHTMIEGEPTENGSGLIRACERAGLTGWTWEPSKKMFTFPNGAVAYGYSAEEPDALRGKQHGAAWMDEPAHYALVDEVWAMLKFGLRMRSEAGRAKVLATSTPKPIKWIKDLIAKDTTRVVRVATHANLSNLDESFREQILEDFEGTRLGRQEIYGEILEDVEGALWTNAMIQHMPIDRDKIEFDSIVVGVDPAGTNTRRSDETGIVVVGRKGSHYYVLADRSGRYSPFGWASLALDLHDEWQADYIIAEKNFGAQMVESTLINAADGRPVRVKPVQSRRGKHLRAEPVVGLYERERVVHADVFVELETQMTEWVPGESDSPDRVDALVHAVTALSKGSGPTTMAIPQSRPVPLSPSMGGMTMTPSGFLVPGRM